MSTTCMLDAFTVSRQSLGERRENSKWTTKGNDDPLFDSFSKGSERIWIPFQRIFSSEDCYRCIFLVNIYINRHFNGVIKFINHNIS